MTNSSPAATPRRSTRWIAWIIVPLAVVIAGGVIVIRATGMVRPFRVPTGAMSPAIKPGDQIIMEGFTYLKRTPRRGDVAVFSTNGIANLPPGMFYVMRIAGEPGERVWIQDEKLLIDGQPVSMTNVDGEIRYEERGVEVTVPPDSYFVLGDNSWNSHDSRFWGFVPAKNIKGRVSNCYLPVERRGKVE